MQLNYPRAVACGDSGLSIEFGDRIDDHLNRKVLALDKALQASPMEGLIETVPTYRALMIHYDPIVISYGELSARALALADTSQVKAYVGRQLTIPVCYEGEHGRDVPEVCKVLGLRPGQLIERHLASQYLVYMLGFQPGFAYLGGLDRSLALPRRPQPRMGAPAGTISIAAAQCAVHAVDGPSGWHWIGRTPIRTRHETPNRPFAIEPGDRIRFTAISAREWDIIHRDDTPNVDLIEVVR